MELVTYFVGLLLCLRLPACATLDSDVDRLVNDLRANYSAYSRPPRDHTQQLTVYISFSIQAIREFDEVNDKFSVIGTVFIAWLDDRLTWIPTDYSGISSILVPNDLFWTPPIFLYNSMEEIKKIGSDPYWTVRYYPNGYGIFYPVSIFSANCGSNVRKFPWDEQECMLFFGIIGYLPDEISLQPYEDSYTQAFENFYGDGLWDMKRRDILTEQNAVVVIYTMRRKPLLAVINVVLPIVLMSFLNIFVFLMPSETGERISFCLTVLLAIAVFMTLVFDSMPKSATSIAYLSYYLASVLVLSILITFATIFSSNLYHREEGENVPGCLMSFTRCVLCKKRRQSTRTGKTSVEFNNKDAYTGDSSTTHSDRPHHQRMPRDDSSNRHVSEPTFTDMSGNGAAQGVYVVSSPRPATRNGMPPQGMHRSVRRERSDKDTDNTAIKDVTWKHVSFACDRIFFVISALLVIGFTVAYFVIASN